MNAPWWLFGLGLVGGIVLVSAFRWLAAMVVRVTYAAGAGPAGLFWFAVHAAGQLVLLALVVRVFGSWFGIGRYNRWMRPAYLLTDWIVEPLRKVIPPIGMFDITPLVAWLLLGFLLGALPR